jgi:hypothetical protein
MLVAGLWQLCCADRDGGICAAPAKHKNKPAAIAEPVLIRIIDFPLETDSNPRRRADPCT